jgi:hypothetical protein
VATRLVISRRRLLLAGAGGLAVAACGGGRRSPDQVGGTTTVPEAAGYTLAPVFYREQPAGVEVRLPLALADGSGVVVDAPPSQLPVRIGPADTGELGEPVVVERHDDGVPRPYFPLVTTFAEPGNWRIVADVDGEPAEVVLAARERSEVPAVAVVGEALIPLATPTVDDARGVDPICTAQPPCPLHEVSLDDAMAGDRAVALLVATPAYCQTAICGPVLDLLVDRQAKYADRVTMIHAEVYTDDSARSATDVVKAYGLVWEPSLFLATPDGTIVERLDYTYDAAELDRALSSLAG